jgi:hypothetical protein
MGEGVRTLLIETRNVLAISAKSVRLKKKWKEKLDRQTDHYLV